MSFFKNALFNERMSPLEYELFRKIHYLTGVTADVFETVLMVTLATFILPQSNNHV
jgi:chitin synthase